MSNVSELTEFLANRKAGETLEIATSQYADNTTAPDHYFDYYTTVQAVLSLVKKGVIMAEYRWRYYEVTILNTGDNK